MFASAADLGLALSCLINPDAFAEVGRMAGAFPKTTVIVDHLGRIGVGGSIDEGEADALCDLARRPNVLPLSRRWPEPMATCSRPPICWASAGQHFTI